MLVRFVAPQDNCRESAFSDEADSEAPVEASKAFPVVYIAEAMKHIPMLSSCLRCRAFALSLHSDSHAIYRVHCASRYNSSARGSQCSHTEEAHRLSPFGVWQRAFTHRVYLMKYFTNYLIS